jgi:plasmid stabilization system protein ParE
VKLRVSARAKQKIHAEDEWWRAERRDAPELFKQELAAAFDRILVAPKSRKQHGQIAGEPVWRVLMTRTEQHVYYTVDDIAAEVTIETVWGACRKRGPKL